MASWCRNLEQFFSSFQGLILQPNNQLHSRNFYKMFSEFFKLTTSVHAEADAIVNWKLNQWPDFCLLIESYSTYGHKNTANLSKIVSLQIMGIVCGQFEMIFFMAWELLLQGKNNSNQRFGDTRVLGFSFCLYFFVRFLISRAFSHYKSPKSNPVIISIRWKMETFNILIKVVVFC